MKWTSGLSLVVVLVGCRPEATEPTGELLADAPVAEKKWPGILIEFGSPSARPFLGEGWSHGETAPDGSAFRWAIEKDASFTFESDRAGPGTAWVECDPYRAPDGTSQVVRFRVNGRSVPPLALRDGRARYPVPIRLNRGRNQVAMSFALTAARSEGDKRRLAAAFYRWEVPSGDASSASGPFALVKTREGRTGIYVRAESSISYYTELPAMARLVVSAGDREPRFLAPAGATLEVRVSAVDGPGELVETRKAAAPRGEVMTLTMDLSSLAGKKVRITLCAEGHDLFLVPELYRAPSKGESASQPEASVNGVLVIVLDGASALRMSAYGYSRPTTPVISELARESVVFDSAVSQAVYTIASVGSLLTGQYPERHQTVSFADRLPASAVTLPGLLTLHGFRTAGFAGNKVVSSVFGLDRGYQEFFEVWNGKGYTGHGDSVTRALLPWLEAHSNDRFFAYVHYREPHFPYDPPAPYDAQFSSQRLFPTGVRDWDAVEALNRRGADADVVARITGLYEGNLAYVDREVGAILEKLDKLALLGRTAVILTADHGEAMFEHGIFGHNTQLYEESVRIPLLIRAPGFVPRRVAAVVELIDLAPTVLELLGVGASPALRDVQGQSLVPLLRGETLPERRAYTRTLWDRPRYSVRDSRFKLIWDSRTNSAELYDLRADPKERSDLIESEPGVGAFYRQKIYKWLREQEHLRSGAASPEETVITEDLGQYLGTVGYLQHLRNKKKAEKQE